jgi:hypothetical protein
VGGVELLERHPELQLEGLLDEIPMYTILNLPCVVREEWVVLNCWKGTLNSSWKRYWDSYSTQPTLCGEGGVGGVELLERHPELQLEGLLEEVLGQVLFLSEAEVGQPLQVGLGRGQQLAVPLL